jgi:catechol 2,3-dioxygenase-like lactoylglutathione lyase family enzyme
MSKMIEKLLSRYEGGRMTRRELVATLTTLAVAPTRLVAQGAPAPVAVRSLNHVSIEVKDVDRSVEFYQRVFGLKVKSREGTPGNPIAGGGSGISVVNLATGAGPEFIGIYNGSAASGNGSIGHFCLGVQNYDADRVMKTLTDQGVKARMRTRGESKEIFVTDPDNISVQLTDVSYCGGSGPFGNKC